MLMDDLDSELLIDLGYNSGYQPGYLYTTTIQEYVPVIVTWSSSRYACLLQPLDLAAKELSQCQISTFAATNYFSMIKNILIS